MGPRKTLLVCFLLFCAAVVWCLLTKRSAEPRHTLYEHWDIEMGKAPNHKASPEMGYSVAKADGQGASASGSATSSKNYSKLGSEERRLKNKIMNKFDGPLGLHMADKIKQQLSKKGKSREGERLATMLKKSKALMRAALEKSVTALLDDSESSGKKSPKLDIQVQNMGRIQKA